MGWFFPAKKVIPTTKAYTLEEVRDTLNQQGGFPSEGVIGGVLGSKGVYFITYMATDVWVRVQKNKISVIQRQMPKASNIVGGIVGGVVGGVIAGVMEGKNKAASWEAYLGRAKYKVDDIVYAVADKVQELFGEQS
jgi:hypothetical protein